MTRLKHAVAAAVVLESLWLAGCCLSLMELTWVDRSETPLILTM
jgi:hypothetical protein